MANSAETTAVKFLKDLGAEFGCKGDIYANTEVQMDALKARVKKLGLAAKEAYEVVGADEQKAMADAKAKASKATAAAKGAANKVEGSDTPSK